MNTVEIKFHALAIGQSFESGGERYTKTSPVVATHQGSGKQKLFARSARVTPLAAVDRPVKNTIDTETVRSILDEYHRQCLECLQTVTSGMEVDLAEDARSRLNTAHELALAGIERKGRGD